MKTEYEDVKTNVKELIKKSKAKNLIKSYTEAFKDFPTNQEVHKGKREFYCK